MDTMTQVTTKQTRNFSLKSAPNSTRRDEQSYSMSMPTKSPVSSPSPSSPRTLTAGP